jgi:hypothetical protein
VRAAAAEPGSWTHRIVAVVVLVGASSALPGELLLAVATAVGTAAAASAVAARLARSWTALASGLLPAAERPGWRAEVRAVLHAAEDGPERRRQMLGFLLGLPSCAVTSRRLARRRT